MIDISMLRISPKLISVELNRVGSDFMKATDHSREGNDRFAMCKNGVGTRSISYESLGRFPTQLFTNIKNDRYKYVKNIT